MARGYTTRKLEVWSMHAHRDGAAVDYREMFRALSSVPASERIWVAGDRLVAIPRLEVADQKAWLVAYEGPTDEQPIILNVLRGQEREAPLGENEIVATKTHALIDLSSREAIIEYNHRGAKASDIAAVLGSVGRRLPGWSNLWVEFNPKVEESFIEAIDEFQRIRVAGFKLARPNFDWGQWQHALTNAAGESGAQNVSQEFTARRGQSLEQGQGVVPFIRARAADLVSGLKSAAIVGTRRGESAETRVTTTDHATHQRVSVRLNPEGQVDDADIERRLSEYEASRESVRRREDDGSDV
jgi:hypothetical protein